MTSQRRRSWPTALTSKRSVRANAKACGGRSQEIGVFGLLGMVSQQDKAKIVGVSRKMETVDREDPVLGRVNTRAVAGRVFDAWLRSFNGCFPGLGPGIMFVGLGASGVLYHGPRILFACVRFFSAYPCVITSAARALPPDAQRVFTRSEQVPRYLNNRTDRIEGLRWRVWSEPAPSELSAPAF